MTGKIENAFDYGILPSNIIKVKPDLLKNALANHTDDSFEVIRENILRDLRVDESLIKPFVDVSESIDESARMLDSGMTY